MRRRLRRRNAARNPSSPEKRCASSSTNRGFPLVLNKPPTLAGLAFEQAAWRLVEQDSMKAVMVEEEPKKHGFFSFFGG
ncbi:BnaC06g23600D [Brassica napus]|uniref:(rape) hypothetical protein n=1 Tax=Brassica napus TaxID=3708 RepID=A0A078FGD8_BRANA|nr:unnamed protein product [Brassica napus]CDY11108.1 BnaC06g23600D [Brassica napus]